MGLLRKRDTFVLEESKEDYVSPVRNSAGACGPPHPVGSIAPPRLRIVVGENGVWPHISNLPGSTSSSPSSSFTTALSPLLAANENGVWSWSSGLLMLTSCGSNSSPTALSHPFPAAPSVVFSQSCLAHQNQLPPAPAMVSPLPPPLMGGLREWCSTKIPKLCLPCRGRHSPVLIVFSPLPYALSQQSRRFFLLILQPLISIKAATTSTTQKRDAQCTPVNSTGAVR